LVSKAQSSAQALIGAIRLTVALSRPRIIPNPARKVFNLTMVRLWQKWAARCRNVGHGYCGGPLGATGSNFEGKSALSLVKDRL
jgi:hypothetical protein